MPQLLGVGQHELKSDAKVTLHTPVCSDVHQGESYYIERSNVAVVVYKHKQGYISMGLQGCITFMWQNTLNVLKRLSPANGSETFVAALAVSYYTNPMLV